MKSQQQVVVGVRPPLDTEAAEGRALPLGALPPPGRHGDAGGEGADDERARAYVVETLLLTASLCFAEASAMRERGQHAPDGGAHATAAAQCERTGRYARVAAAWLARNGAGALLGPCALPGDVERAVTPSRGGA